MTKAKTIMRPGKSSPASSRFVIQGASTTELHQKNGDRNTKPFAVSAITAHLQRVSITDSFGASPASSALDVSAKRDPGGNSFNLTHHREIKSDLAQTHLNRVKQHLS
jgi:hypothetical protein